ncbi:MAG TPA: hypothetical protein VK796_12225 [Cytophaga sp.]|jgi:hypothetical protein|nr:hypothetical protein [Cytophaga sp.]
MKVYTNICIFFGMLLFSSIAQGQITYKTYAHPKCPFQIDTAFNPVSQNFSIISPMNHLWLTNSNSQYMDMTKNRINVFAVPEYREIKNRGLFGPRNVQKQMNAGLYYHPSFFQTIPQYGIGAYNPTFQPYTSLPYGYSSYTIKASGSPYYILPKF